MDTCVVCHDALAIELDDLSDGVDEAGPSAGALPTVPDDVELSCRCHFHWECLLDAYNSPVCPNCGQNLILTQTPQILCNLTNEGGHQAGLDILPLLTEEAYLRQHPADRICRAFLEFCREGDVASIVKLLKDCDEPDPDDDDDDDDKNVPKKSADEVLRYRDPLGDMQSGLHAAVASSKREVAWLLLLLASDYPELEFPALVYQEAASLGIMRSDQTGQVDIRSLKDAEGRSAEDVAREVGGVWHGWVGTGQLVV